MDIPIPLQKPKYRNLATSTPTALAFAPAAEITLVQLDLTAHPGYFIAGNFLVDRLAQFVEKQDRSITIYARQIGCGTCCCACAEILDKLNLNTMREPAAPPYRNHLTLITFFCYLCQPHEFCLDAFESPF